MTYTSFNFLLFTAAVALLYFLLPLKKYRWTVLLAANVFFYAVAGYRYAAFILFTTASTYVAALWIERLAKNSRALLKAKKGEWSRDEKKKHKSRVDRNKRLILALALVLNFGILAYLKYFGFFAGSLNSLLGPFGINLSVPVIKVLGISFYTFQSMGYIVDVYREKVTAQRNPLRLLLFVSFFPQIVQGPISAYSQLGNQLFEPHDFDFTRFKHGCELILWGFFKKLIIADKTAIAINTVTAGYNSYCGTTLTFTILLYALQLYADFSGGIDISRGVAQILGIDMIENFKRPYFSRSISEYWRRWHISLGAWMKDYVFYPIAMSGLFLGVSKKIRGTRFGKCAAGAHIAKVLPTSVASLIVFLLVGIWHGASGKYVAFGVWNGGIIMLSILIQPLFDALAAKLHINRECFAFRLFQMFRTFLVVLVGYVFDVAPTFSQSIRTFVLFFTDWNFALGRSQIASLGVSLREYIVVLVFTMVLFTASVIQERHAEDGVNIRQLLDAKPFALRWAVLFAGVISIVIFGVYGSGYNAADFVYMQF